MQAGRWVIGIAWNLRGRCGKERRCGLRRKGRPLQLQASIGVIGIALYLLDRLAPHDSTALCRLSRVLL